MKIKNILFLMVAIFAFTSCNDDSDPVLPQYKASELTHPADGETYVLLQDNAAKTLFTLSWLGEIQDQLLVGPATYIVQIDSVGRDFSRPVILAQVLAKTDVTSSTYTYAPTVEEINKIISNNLKLKPEILADLEIRVITKIGNVTLPATASNVFRVKMVPYVPIAPILYIVGEGLVGWGNDSKNIGKDLQLFFSNSNADALAGKFSYTGYFNGGKGMKIITKAGDWGTAYGSGGNETLVANGGGDILVPAASGYYTFSIDTKKLTYSFSVYAEGATATTYSAMGVIGSATAGAWDTDQEMVQATPHVWVLREVSLTAAEIKFRANKAWATGGSWGGDSANQPYGIGNTNNNNNIAIEKADKYMITFNDLTKAYVITPTSKLP